jgi:hypothetical protein
MFQNLVNFSHIPKFRILGCDKATPLKRNLVPKIQMDRIRNFGTQRRVSERGSCQVSGLTKNVLVSMVEAFMASSRITSKLLAAFKLVTHNFLHTPIFFRH